jgi:lysophospholipase L1-like esterase
MIEDSLRLNARVLLTTIFPVGEVPLQRRLVWSDDIQQAVVEVNDHLRSLASEDVIVFDAAALLSDASGKMRPEYRDDELHLNDAGYEALNAELISLLGNIQHESE